MADEKDIYECMAKLAIKELTQNCVKCPLCYDDCEAFYGDAESFSGVLCEDKLYKHFYSLAEQKCEYGQ